MLLMLLMLLLLLLLLLVLLLLLLFWLLLLLFLFVVSIFCGAQRAGRRGPYWGEAVPLMLLLPPSVVPFQSVARRDGVPFWREAVLKPPLMLSF